MKTNIIVTIGGFCMLVLTGTTLSIAQESKEYCKLEFSITGSEVDVVMFDVSFTKSTPYQKSKCEVDLKNSMNLADERVRKVYICSVPNNKVISAATRSYEQLLEDEKNANEREDRRRKHQGLLLHDRPLLASIDDPANVLAQVELGSAQLDFAVSAASCVCGTSGPCSTGGMRCSKLHPSCPPC
jgi:hypothetical protein